jgi:hypothetical protein
VDATPPTHSKFRDITQVAGLMAANSLPVVGGAVGVALEKGLNYTLNLRREQWFADLAAVVAELEERLDRFDPNTLAENDAFVDAVIAALRIVDGTSQRLKLDALRNAVINAASQSTTDRDVQSLYFGLIGDLTPTHIRILNMLNKPRSWFREQFGFGSDARPFPLDILRAVRETMPDLEEAFGSHNIARFYADLYDRGLLMGRDVVSADVEERESFVSQFGSGFLRFIQDPRGTRLP